jgi:hypothetical protein
MAHAHAFPLPLRVLAVAYLVASLSHFAHNAVYIAFYPGMPAWITHDTVWLAWLGVTAVGACAFVLARLARPTLALFVLAVYGGFGLDGLAHYTLALCSEHTLATNITIWSEAATGLALALCCAVLLSRRLREARA